MTGSRYRRVRPSGRPWVRRTGVIAVLAAVVALAAAIAVAYRDTHPAAPTAAGRSPVARDASPVAAPYTQSATLLAAGDIADCDDAARRTGSLLARLPGVVAALGDLAYPDGAIESFRSCYDPAWGDLLDRTRPAQGNHDVRTRGAAGYYSYLGAIAGPRPQGYYSYALGTWHIVVLNSNCEQVGGCDAASPQGRWLRDDLATAGTGSILAYWHHPRFSTGFHGDDTAVADFWRLLHDAGADVVLNGHDHDYQRFARIDPQGQPDAHGIREFVVGTGGADLRDFSRDAPSILEYRQNTTHGILRLDLGTCGYRWEFLPADDRPALDQGSNDGTCSQQRQPAAASRPATG